eukprot:scaffold24669_cov124-Isochrysis_galbana.AAC.3
MPGRAAATRAGVFERRSGHLWVPAGFRPPSFFCPCRTSLADPAIPHAARTVPETTSVLPVALPSFPFSWLPFHLLFLRLVILIARIG